MAETNLLRQPPKRCKIGDMKTSIELDEQLSKEVEKVVSLIGEKPATVIRMAVRAGLPLVANRFQAARPEGYFSDDYPLPQERLDMEAAMSKVKAGPAR